MKSVDCHYSGICEGGPWDRQILDADLSIMHTEIADGHYIWVTGNRWLWAPDLRDSWYPKDRRA